MTDFLLRLIVNAVALALTAQLLPGINIADDSLVTLLIVALIFGIVNALVKPIVKFLTCPFVLITLGLFILVINGLMLMLTAALSGGRLVVENIWWAILGGIIMGIVGVVLEWVLGIREGKSSRQIIRG